MKFTNPGQFEKMRRLEGMRSRADIWDLDTLDDIREEIRKKMPNIREELDRDRLTPELKSTLGKIMTFCDELSEKFRERFLSLLNRYSSEKRQVSQKIIDYLFEKKFNLPVFTVAGGDSAEALLKECGLGSEISDQGLLLVFQLPKPLAQFWWKGGAESWGSAAKDIEGSAIEWGHFYRELMPIIWETQGYYENEFGLRFDRVNDVGKHDPKKYYYIWQASEWSKSHQ